MFKKYVILHLKILKKNLMKRIILWLLIYFPFQFTIHAQIVSICNESFESTLNNWTINPAYSWVTNVDLHMSGQKSYIGYVPALNGDSVMLTTPFYDLTHYAYVHLKFNHICKVSKYDTCQIEYRENYSGAVWRSIPTSSYQGNGIYTNAVFQDSSYSNWQSSNLMAMPTNFWWHNETFDVSDEVSYAIVQFRFKIKRGNVVGTHFAYGWLIDDFQILASTNPIIPPHVSFVSTYNDTVYNTGVFPITAIVASRTLAPIDTPILKYNAFFNNTYTYDSITMNSVEGDTMWTAIIPQHLFGTKLVYSIHAIDTFGNTNQSQSGFYIKRLPPFDSNSVAMYRINSPDSVVSYNSSAPVNVTIKNKGILNLNIAMIYWSVNGAVQTPVSWIGDLPDDFNANVSLGNYNSGNYGTYDTLKIWVEIPNGKQDPITNDDTITCFVYNCQYLLKGDYIIGNSSYANFTSINSALHTLTNADCITGDICFKIENGTYTQNIDLTNYANYLGNYSLTITSLANHKDSVILNDTAGVLITLNNTNNIYLKNITLDISIRGTYAIQFTGNANNIEIRNCNIFANPVATTNANIGILKSANTGIANNIRIINNVLNGGYNNLRIDGGTLNNYATTYIIDSNTCTNADNACLYLIYLDVKSISYNKVYTRNADGHINSSCISISYGNANEIIGNKLYINRPQSTTNIYGLYLWQINKTSTSPIIIKNNEIRIYSSSNITYGVYSHTSKFNFYHNSILTSTPIANGAGLHIYSGAATLYNNLFYNINLHPIAVGSSSVVSDYNNLQGGSFNLASWQSYSGQDAHSISMQPPFIDTAINLELSNYNLFTCPRLIDVSTDINGSYRTSLTTMGAYSVPFWEGYNLEASAIISPVSSNGALCNSSNFSTVQMSIRNSGTDTIKFFINPMRLYVKVTGAINYQKDTLINTGYLTVGKTDTFTITQFLPTLANGNYNITLYLECNIDTVPSDDTIRSVYVISKIALPYDINFSTYPAELLIKSISGNVHWNVVSGAGTNPVISSVYGTGRLEFQGSLETGSLSQAILSGIDLSTGIQPRLGFWYAHNNVYSRDLMIVKISTDEGLTTIPLISVQLFDPSTSGPCWKYYEIDLSYYGNETCFTIIFEASSFGGGNQSLDRIRIAGYSDMRLSLLLPDFNNSNSCSFSNQPIKVVMENLTKQNIIFNNHSEVIVRIRNADSINYVYPLSSNGTLYGYASDTLTIDPPFDFQTGLTYDFTAYIHRIDSNTANDTSKITYNIFPDISLDSIQGVDQINCKQVGDSVYITLFIKNTGNTTITNIPLQLRINKSPELLDTLFASIQAGDTMSHKYTKPYIVPMATFVQPYYAFSIKTAYPCDADTNNNKIDLLPCVDLDPIIDISLLEIQRPYNEICDSGRTQMFAKILIENKGNVDIENAIIHLRIDSADTQIQLISDTIPSITSYTTFPYEFTKSYTVPNLENTQQTYAIKAFIEHLNDDTDILNDTITKLACSIYNDVSIKNTTTKQWHVGQNIPNPATHAISIPYSIPQEGNICFQLMSISGQTLFEKTIHTHSGNHYLEINTLPISNGMYYYSITYRGERIVKKMTIQK
jgi:hypothetical protein